MSWFHPASPLLPDILRNNAEQRGSREALVCGESRRNWRDLHADLLSAARVYKDLGLQPGEGVAILMQNGNAMFDAMLGAVCGGFVAVPLNTSVADEGISKQIGDCDARAVVATGEHRQRIDAMRSGLPPGIGARFLTDGEAAPGWLSFTDLQASAPAEPVTAVVDAADACNIIYSSGTTGLPKGIVHSHACRMAWAYDMSIALHYHSDVRTLVSLGLYSNITWVTLLSTVLCGGTLVLMPGFDVDSCLATIEKESITHSGMVPVQFQRMLSCPGFDEYDLGSVQALMCCGSPMHADMKKQVVERIPGEFIELYGLTEGLVTIQSPADAADNPASVGRPCPGQMLRILDRDDRPVAVGEAGEIVGYGRLLMSGYLNRDAANEQACWLDGEGRRWLRTGDIGRLDSDGNLYLVDRKKDMIISGGQNIFPADIEAVVQQYAGVSDVAVIGVPSEHWGESPLAIVCGESLDTAALLDWVNARLGRQQRVAAAVVVDELPRNPNGKVLKRELRKRFADTLAGAGPA